MVSIKQVFNYKENLGSEIKLELNEERKVQYQPKKDFNMAAEMVLVKIMIENWRFQPLFSPVSSLLRLCSSLSQAAAHFISKYE